MIQNRASMNENELSNKIIDVAFRLHSALGPGLLESAYEAAFYHDLIEQGLEVRRQLPVSFSYNGMRIE
jgi:GxxExxY protein